MALSDEVFASPEEAIDLIKEGKMIIVVDDEDRENEGDLLMAASKVTSESINFMTKYGRGLVCVPLTEERARQLDLEPMVTHSTDPHGTAFTVSVDAKNGTTTGISAEDRAATAQLLADPCAKSSDFRRPGHMFPLIARKGGVLKRAGHTEAAVDLARLAGLEPVGVICEIMNDDGTMARLPQLIEFAKKFGLKIMTIKSLIRYRHLREKLVERVSTVDLPTEYGKFVAHAYRWILDDDPDMLHIALVKGDIKEDDEVLVRVHSECLTGDVFGSLRCDCGPQLHRAMQMIEQEGKGIVLYMRQEGRGIGLYKKLKAYELQEKGLDTVEANIKLGVSPDLRDYGVGAQILFDLGVRKLRLMTNNPKKVIGLEGYGLEVIDRVPIEVEANSYNLNYLKTKKEKLGHLFD
ncbi:3,4-dihydroxy 2-butanone 4-phosphate synthase / GTP cyclohydrolase II [Acetomicrobium thermoterrenum DSM 13490]|uniref:Riboflavin biosynthesis protein RibBA n=1 Tax=Acetomicrobium thermoterrenum DSM 13490 TaxID=1120987 RepID=A0A1H3GLC5_9BACT|nr:bifunctional 3,4-dihydroxy-2-butanone-4-phosphate synthase/GTP cyclohydrolase II [Acetomicrobium thermoterrenum]SDY03907.1 3,4-dihydroxy 2-butanone 4-phosphate synthase / GTP cyclohydrolase II [Acetomicrobium thermoterrenum DSM 13490]